MEESLKQLLLTDLCARLPYGLQVKTEGDNEPYILLSVHLNKDIALIGIDMGGIYATSKVKIDTVKPYLRPMSSMTEEEKKELLQISNFNPENEDIDIDAICIIERGLIEIADIANFIDWLNAHHFDFRGLIEKGLAIEVTKDNNPYKE